MDVGRAARFQYECHDATGRWWRSYGNELWDGLMRRREPSINDVPIASSDRRWFGPRPDDERGPEHDSHCGERPGRLIVLEIHRRRRDRAGAFGLTRWSRAGRGESSDSMDREPAVDKDRLTGDVAGSAAGEEYRRAGEVLGYAVATDHRARRQRRHLLRVG